MSSGQQVPDAVQWHEGMLLVPQHFQLAASRAEELLAYHVRTASPFHWGVRRLRHDPALLVGGTYRVTELEAVLPDGLLVLLGPDRGAPLEVELDAEAARRGPLTVHLAVPARRREGEPFAGSLPRYESVDGRPVLDENTGDGAVAIPRLRPRATLLVTATPPDKYVSLPLARISFKDETFALTEFVPPALEVAVSSPLGSLCGRVARRVREKAVYLSERVRTTAGAGPGRAVAQMQAAASSLVSELPHLEAVLATGATHPYPVYLALCTLAGRLAAVGTGLVPPVFPRYDHDDPWGSFVPVVDFCTRMLDAVQETYTATLFHFEEGSFTLALRPEWVGRTLLVGVAGPAGMSEADAAAWMQEARIASRNRMPSVRERRIRGAERRPVENAGDLGLVVPRGVVLFAIRADAEFIDPDEVLQIAHPAEHTGRPRPREISLFTRSRS